MAGTFRLPYRNGESQNPDRSVLHRQSGLRDEERKAATAGLTHILLTHGHGDHVGDTVAIAKETGATVLANFDLCMWLGRQGISKLEPGNTGGTIQLGSFTATFVNALHSSAQITDDGVSHSLGNANGLVLHFDDEPTLYHMGDTEIFSDMALVQELHEPEIGIVPIGDRFTMAVPWPRSRASVTSSSTRRSLATMAPSRSSTRRRRPSLPAWTAPRHWSPPPRSVAR